MTGTQVVWKSNRGSSFIPSALLYSDHLYMVDDTSSVATCCEAATTGQALWQGRMGEALKEGFTASPVAVGGQGVLHQRRRGNLRPQSRTPV